MAQNLVDDFVTFPARFFGFNMGAFFFSPDELGGDVVTRFILKGVALNRSQLCRTFCNQFLASIDLASDGLGPEFSAHVAVSCSITEPPRKGQSSILCLLASVCRDHIGTPSSEDGTLAQPHGADSRNPSQE